MQILKRTIANKTVLILLVSILMLASVLRFYGLANQSLYNDELSSWLRSSYGDLSTVIDRAAHRDVHPPAYHILLYFVEKYIGDSETALRFPSALAGVLSVFAMFLVGARLYSYREGLIASAFMAVFWCPIYYSQEARAYSLVLLFTLLTTYFWLSLLKSLAESVKPSAYTIFGYILMAVLCSYLHYFGVYIVGLQGLGALFFFIRRRKAFVYMAMIYFAVLLLYSPWLPSMYRHLSMGPIYIKLQNNIILTGGYYLYFLFNRSLVLPCLALGMYLFLLVHSLRKIPKSGWYNPSKAVFFTPGMFLLLWLLVPFAGVYIKSMISAPVLTNRNLIISLPAAYLLLSRCLTQLPISSRKQVIITCVIVALFLSDLTLRMDYYSKPHKAQFREAAGVIVDRDHLYEDSMIIGYTHAAEYLDYYFRKMGCHRRVSLIGGQEKDIPKVAAAIAAEKPKYVWYVHAHRIPESQFMKFLHENLKFLSHKNFVGAKVYLFENK
ncbi:MAG: glycosyltransferase family 39 protein [Desulfobacteraceae bacterium]|nr:glycosyltransferase family 39 protein [Desulfobacteraceae bacterium]